jgi:nucleotide-binding universal stress UspA family protein
MNRFKNILCVVKPEETSKLVIERAVSLAQQNQATLTIVNVVRKIVAGVNMPEGGPISNELQTAVQRDHEERLKPLIAPYRKQINIDFNVLTGEPFLEIIRQVLRCSHDLVIKEPDKHDWLDQFLGSEDMHLLRKCPCPIWLIKTEKTRTRRQVLAAIDVGVDNFDGEQKSLNKLNTQILEMAGSLAISDFAELHVAHVWNAPGESSMRGAFLKTPEEQILSYVDQIRQQHESKLNQLLEELKRKLGTDVDSYISIKKHLIKGLARKEIPNLAKHIDADIIVMGTVARTGIPGFFMGNTAETILNQIDCSVLAIKPDGFKTPVELEV